MADPADLGNEQAAHWLAAKVAEAAKELPAGKPGVCYLCDQYSQRLILCACARCRDENGLP